MWAVGLSILLGVMMFIMGTMLMRGKWSFLIAGYNTAPEKEKRKYNKKKLCRANGIVCITASAMMFSIACCGYQVETGRMAEEEMLVPAGIFGGLLVLSVIISQIYARRCCKEE